jgi:Tfp pilus assembly protein PilN
MKPVNLIPPEQRRDARRGAAARVGFATRALLGVLGFTVLAVLAMVLVSNQINSKKSELADLSVKQQAAAAERNALEPYGDFMKIEQARTTTIAALARSRFNWERFLRQLSRTVPPNVWITGLSGSVSSASSSSAGGGGGQLRGGVPGPAVDLQGCAQSQQGSAQMLSRMRLLDGVSSVTLSRSERPDNATGGSAAASSSGSSGSAGGGAQSCPRYQFDMLVAFEAPESVGTGAGTQAVAAGTTGTTGTSGPQGSTGGQGTTGSQASGGPGQ